MYLVDFEASCPRSLLPLLRDTHLDLGQTGGASKSTKGGQPGVRPETMLAMLSCNGHHSTAQRFLHPSLLRTAATLTQLEAHEGVEQGGSGGVVGRQRARPERQETCPAGASGRWQRMRSASPGLSSTRTRGLSVVDRGTQTVRHHVRASFEGMGLSACNGLPTPPCCGGSQAHVRVARMGGGVLRCYQTWAYSG